MQLSLCCIYFSNEKNRELKSQGAISAVQCPQRKVLEEVLLPMAWGEDAELGELERSRDQLSHDEVNVKDGGSMWGQALSSILGFVYILSCSVFLINFFLFSFDCVF